MGVSRVGAPSPLTPPSSFLPSCVAKGQPLCFPGPQFPHPCQEDWLDLVQGSRRDFAEVRLVGTG